MVSSSSNLTKLHLILKNLIILYINFMILYKVRKYVDKQTLRNMYYTFVFPYLINCNEIWGNACQAYVEQIINLYLVGQNYDIFLTLLSHRTVIQTFKKTCLLKLINS